MTKQQLQTTINNIDKLTPDAEAHIDVRNHQKLIHTQLAIVARLDMLIWLLGEK